MTDMIQDLREEIDDLRSTGEVEAVDELDDLRSTGEVEAVDELDELRSTGEVEAVEEAVNEAEEATDEAPATVEAVSDESTDSGDEEPVEENEVTEAPVAEEAEKPEQKDEEPVAAVEAKEEEKAPVVKSEPVAEEKPEPVTEKTPEVKPEPAPVIETKAEVKPAVVADTKPENKPEPAAISNSSSDDEYHPSLALKVFTILRHGFIVFFDIVLTGVAIVLERILDLDWAGYRDAVVGAFQSADDAMRERVPQKYLIAIYAVIAILIFGLPIGFGAFSFFTGNNAGTQQSNGQTVTVSQQNAAVANNGILSPLFTPTVHLWAEDIERWTANSTITPDMLATVMQLESCGNVNVQSGLFGVGDANAGFNDPDSQANIAIERLEAALISSNGDFGMAMAIYSGGENIMNTDFTAWSQHTRDMFILGRTILHHTEIGMTDSPDLNSWLQTTGAVLCSEAQSANNQ